jgi:hypothetical protein
MYVSVQGSEYSAEGLDRVRLVFAAGQEAAEPVLLRREGHANHEQLAQGKLGPML